eukprot:TRINITY_DN26653_c0_g1_i1.p1 TRINITY_DN26653_c0_g1~~TRINITY_DN26653_c0_g1_i1.p1  ORF type:complete len:1243 (-),score=420.34 TRINITY_DN26653_c0_g1_i1:382-4110(-)
MSVEMSVEIADGQEASQLAWESPVAAGGMSTDSMEIDGPTRPAFPSPAVQDLLGEELPAPGMRSGRSDMIERDAAALEKAYERSFEQKRREMKKADDKAAELRGQLDTLQEERQRREDELRQDIAEVRLAVRRVEATGKDRAKGLRAGRDSSEREVAILKQRLQDVTEARSEMQRREKAATTKARKEIADWVEGRARTVRQSEILRRQIEKALAEVRSTAEEVQAAKRDALRFRAVGDLLEVDKNGGSGGGGVELLLTSSAAAESLMDIAEEEDQDAKAVRSAASALVAKAVSKEAEALRAEMEAAEERYSGVEAESQAAARQLRQARSEASRMRELLGRGLPSPAACQAARELLEERDSLQARVETLSVEMADETQEALRSKPLVKELAALREQLQLLCRSGREDLEVLKALKRSSSPSLRGQVADVPRRAPARPEEGIAGTGSLEDEEPIERKLLDVEAELLRRAARAAQQLFREELSQAELSEQRCHDVVVSDDFSDDRRLSECKGLLQPLQSALADTLALLEQLNGPAAELRLQPDLCNWRGRLQENIKQAAGSHSAFKDLLSQVKAAAAGNACAGNACISKAGSSSVDFDLASEKDLQHLEELQALRARHANAETALAAEMGDLQQIAEELRGMMHRRGEEEPMLMNGGAAAHSKALVECQILRETEAAAALGEEMACSIEGHKSTAERLRKWQLEEEPLKLALSQEASAIVNAESERCHSEMQAASEQGAAAAAAAAADVALSIELPDSNGLAAACVAALMKEDPGDDKVILSPAVTEVNARVLHLSSRLLDAEAESNANAEASAAASGLWRQESERFLRMKDKIALSRAELALSKAEWDEVHLEHQISEQSACPESAEQLASSLEELFELKRSMETIRACVPDLRPGTPMLSMSMSRQLTPMTSPGGLSSPMPRQRSDLAVGPLPFQLQRQESSASSLGGCSGGFCSLSTRRRRERICTDLEEALAWASRVLAVEVGAAAAGAGVSSSSSARPSADRPGCTSSGESSGHISGSSLEEFSRQLVIAKACLEERQRRLVLEIEQQAELQRRDLEDCAAEEKAAAAEMEHELLLEEASWSEERQRLERRASMGDTEHRQLETNLLREMSRLESTAEHAACQNSPLSADTEQATGDWKRQLCEKGNNPLAVREAPVAADSSGDAHRNPPEVAEMSAALRETYGFLCQQQQRLEEASKERDRLQAHLAVVLERLDQRHQTTAMASTMDYATFAHGALPTT